MTTLTQTYFRPLGLTQRLQAIRTQIADAMERRKVYRTTLNELESLTSRDLDDLGISRTMIRDIAYEAAYGK